MEHVWVGYKDYGYEGCSSPEFAGDSPDGVLAQIRQAWCERWKSDELAFDARYPIVEAEEDYWFVTNETQEQAGNHPRIGWRIDKLEHKRL